VDLRAGERIAMGLVQRMMRWLADFYRALDRGLAVMRGEKSVAGHTPGVDWSRKKGREFTSGRRCCRERDVR
jgi:hypothetical protein